MIVVDSSAVIALILDEPEAPRLARKLFDRTGDALMSTANYVEFGIVAAKRLGRASVSAGFADSMVARFGLTLAPVDVEQARIAVEAYARFGKGSRHPAKLNYGDTFAYALARVRNAPLLYCGKDFARTDVASALP